MATNKSNVKVDIDVATKAAEIALKNFETNIKKTDQSWDLFKANLASQFTFKGLESAGKALLNFSKEVINVAAEAEQSSKNLSIALNNVGLSSQKTFQDLTKFAEGLELTSQYSAQAIQDSAALLAQLTTLDSEGIQTATKSAVDLASALNLDLKTATDLMIKGIGGQTTAFKRYGLEIKAGATATENFANILKATSHLEGSAAKQTETFTGAQIQLTNAYNKVYESIGKIIIQNPTIINGMKSLTEIFASMANFISKNAEDILLFGKALGSATAIVLTAGIAIKAYTAGIWGLTIGLGAVANAASVAWAAVTGPIGLAVIAIGTLGAALYGIVKYWEDIKVATLEATAATLEYAAKAAGIFSGNISTSLNKQAQALRDQAKATREAKDASLQKNEVDTQLEQQEEKRQNRRRARLAELQRLNADNAKFTENLLKQQEENKTLESERSLERARQYADLETEILKNALENREIDYYEYHERKNEIDAQLYEQRQQLLLEQEAAELERVNSAREAELITVEQHEQAKNAIYTKYAEQKLKLGIEQQKKELKSEQDLEKEKKRIRDLTISGTANMFGALADLAEMGGRRGFEVAKKFNIAQIILSGIQHVMKAAELPFPANIPAIVQATAFSAAQLAKARATQPSFAEGGVFGGFNGVSMGPDNGTANVRRGEMILNGAQQKTLFDIANNRGNNNSNGVEDLLSRLISTIQNQPVVVNVGGRTVVETIRSELESGRTFA